MLPLRRVELRRAAQAGTELAGDSLSAEGIERAHRLGRSIRVGYTHLYSCGTQRATQTLACVLAGMGRHVIHGVAVRPGLRPARASEWRDAVRAAGGTGFAALLEQAPALVKAESQRLAAELHALLTELPEGSYALAITDTPAIECAAYGITGTLHETSPEGGGLIVVEEKGGRVRIDLIDSY